MSRTQHQISRRAVFGALGGSAALILAGCSLRRSAQRILGGMPPTGANTMELEQTDLFVSGQGGYHTYRIPALLTTAAGTLLAFCEGRKHSRSDSGDIDIVLRRSTDNGETWSAMQVVADAGPDVFGNPCPVQDRTTGTI